MINPNHLHINQMSIRQATEDDLPALEWDGEYTHFRLLFREIYLAAELGEALLWVLDLPGIGIVGQLFVQLWSERPELADGKDCAYIYGFRVKPAYQGYGLGSRLLDHAEQDLVRRGYRQSLLNVARVNQKVRQMYEKRGYRVVAIEPGRWSYRAPDGNRIIVDEPSWRMLKNLVHFGINKPLVI